MYLTHHFAHDETLTRARSWLEQLGWKPHQIRILTGDFPRIMVEADPHSLAEVRILINAVERADPDGFPSFWDEARRPHHAPVVAIESALAPDHQQGSARIGWHPPDHPLAADPALKAISEAMSH